MITVRDRYRGYDITVVSSTLVFDSFTIWAIDRKTIPKTFRTEICPDPVRLVMRARLEIDILHHRKEA